MARLDVRVGPDVEASLRRRINEVIQDERLLNEVGAIAAADIKAHIVATKEPETGRNFAVPTITPEWQKRKKRLSTTNQAFDAASGGGTRKARLIFTGQFINSIIHRIGKLNGRKVIEVGPTGMHQPYVGIKGGPVGKSIPNEKLGQYLKDGGRDWTGFPARIQKRLVTAARNFIRRELT